MRHEHAVQLERFPLLHKFAPGKDSYVIGDKHGRCCRQGRQRCLARNEDEFVGRVPHHRLESFVEERP